MELKIVSQYFTCWILLNHNDHNISEKVKTHYEVLYLNEITELEVRYFSEFIRWELYSLETDECLSIGFC